MFGAKHLYSSSLSLPARFVSMGLLLAIIIVQFKSHQSKLKWTIIVEPCGGRAFGRPQTGKIFNVHAFKSDSPALVLNF